MLRLVLRTGHEAGRILLLDGGALRVGRDPGNGCVLDHPSVSPVHCEIRLEEDGTFRIRDLGSETGTFVNSMVIDDAPLEPGQVLGLGAIEFLVEAGEEGEPAAGQVVRFDAEGGGWTGSGHEVKAGEGELLVCQLHPDQVAAWRCSQCRALWCGDCPGTLRAGSTVVRSCPSCRGMCRPAAGTGGHGWDRAGGFLVLMPGALRYPVAGEGWVILLAGTFFFSLLDAAQFLAGYAPLLGLVAAAFLTVFTFGYLFLFMQNVITVSAEAGETPPGWPEFTNAWDDLALPSLRLVTIGAVCAGPGFALWGVTSPWVAGLVLLLGLCGMPMMLLAVALADSLSGLNPRVVVVSIFRVPGPYTVVCGMFVLVLGLRIGAEWVMEWIPVPLLPTVLINFVALYGLTVTMRVLGLLYWRYKDRLGWFR